ncbi:MAG: hypothetical protein HRT94_07850 [Alphaproteobacteria bacterium]|nr:hypothetical protein [Alphaproteobacteria bacterium]
MNNSGKKFLFDLNKFDEPDAPEIIEEIIEEEIEPPPPTFSEDELEAAKAVSFTQGKSEGIQEERAKREQELTRHLGTISQQFQTLFANEIYREKAYEHEAIQLALEITEHLAPTLEDKLGADVLQKTIENAVMAQSKQSEIIIEVAETATEEINTLLDRVKQADENAPKFKIKSSSELSEGACRLSWKDGGMVRDPKETAQSIKNELEKLLSSEQKPENIEETVPDTPKDDINIGVDSAESTQSPVASSSQQETGDSHD